MRERKPTGKKPKSSFISENPADSFLINLDPELIIYMLEMASPQTQLRASWSHPKIQKIVYQHFKENILTFQKNIDSTEPKPNITLMTRVRDQVEKGTTTIQNCECGFCTTTTCLGSCAMGSYLGVNTSLTGGLKIISLYLGGAAGLLITGVAMFGCSYGASQLSECIKNEKKSEKENLLSNAIRKRVTLFALLDKATLKEKIEEENQASLRSIAKQ